MAYPRLAGVWLSNTPFDSLVQTHQLANVFAMCLSPQGGVMTLVIILSIPKKIYISFLTSKNKKGGIDSKLYTGSIQWTPIKREVTTSSCDADLTNPF